VGALGTAMTGTPVARIATGSFPATGSTDPNYRCAYRYYKSDPGDQYDHFGFRVVSSPFFRKIKNENTTNR